MAEKITRLDAIIARLEGETWNQGER